ncbi:hypothetical protein [Agaribacter flavus]|uniref:Uncharacterized protein n=1 Tax=Agaribacter flavus TaxID=1902781 RepID=A0ABV7FQA8_9ALTE
MALSQESEAPFVQQDIPVSKAKVYADFYHVMYAYFEENYLIALNVMESAERKHGFGLLDEVDQDRLTLIQGAALLNLGLNSQAQNKFTHLLNKNSSQYIHAHTWYWLAKTAFETGQTQLSLRAYDAISAHRLAKELAFEHWQELLYMSAHAMMQEGKDWKSLLPDLSEESIYPAYLHANAAGQAFNRGNYFGASERYVQAKQALITYQQRQDTWLDRTQSSGRLLAHSLKVLITPWRWFSDDPNAKAARRQQIEQEKWMRLEQDALFDRLNLHLAYSLLKQQEDEHALAVLRNISADSGDTQQAMLTLGWAHAQQNRWSSATDIWQYLRTHSLGIYQLQASYGLAYAFQQQGQFVEAYYALDDTSAQIESTLEHLQSFSDQVEEPAFSSLIFDDDTQWPAALTDIKRSFLMSNSVAKDTSKTSQSVSVRQLLSARKQLQEVLDSLQSKSRQLSVLKDLSNERKQHYQSKIDRLSTTSFTTDIANTQDALMRLRSRLHPTNQLERDDLSLAMMSKAQSLAWQRLGKAKQRHSRLLADPPRNRPLKASYQERITRIEGILRWQMEDSYIVKRWAHLRAFDKAKNEAALAQHALTKISGLKQGRAFNTVEQSNMTAIEREIVRREEQAKTLFSRAETQLREVLLAIIDERRDQLKTQWVNTRLAKIRLQDLQAEVSVQ